MAYAHKVCKVTISGTMFNGNEVWSTGFYLGNKSAGSSAPDQAAADAVLAAWTTFFSSAGSGISTSYRTTAVKLASLNSDTSTIADEVVYAYPGTTVSGGVSIVTLPPQCAMVATLTTVRPRGRASKGRMYLPGIANSVSNEGKASSSLVGTMATNLQTFFNAINSNFGMPGKVILASQGEGVVGSLIAQNEWVTGLRIGDVIDTQRRRRNGLVEIYTNRTITA